jgi:DNA-binding CsgD family transcriptional regulator/transcription elongation factor Elf1
MKEKIIALVKQGKTYKEIKKELGCALSTIAYHCKKEGILNENMFKKIDIATIQKINELYQSGLTSIQVAKELDIAKSTVLKYIEKVRKNKLSDAEVKKNKVKHVIHWRIKAKKLLVEYKGGECERCGYNKCIDALEFHHKNKNEKDFSISGKSWSFEKLKNEVDKCILVCANCHREIHFEIKNISEKVY